MGLSEEFFFIFELGRRALEDPYQPESKANTKMMLLSAKKKTLPELPEYKKENGAKSYWRINKECQQ